MLAQTGCTDVSQFFAQTQPQTSEMSAQTEPEIANHGANVQQTTQALDEFMEGQEQMVFQNDTYQTHKQTSEDKMSQIVKLVQTIHCLSQDNAKQTQQQPKQQRLTMEVQTAEALTALIA